jgi:hypothetical protein
MDDLDQIALRVHYGLDGPVSSRRFTYHIFVLAAFNASRRPFVIGSSEL